MSFKLQRGIIAAVLFFLFVSFVFAEGRAENAAKAGDEKIVVASTSWVAAIARAGGARNVRILAPVNLRHPPEYELKPSDLRAVNGADVVIYAGWEMFAQKLTETAGGAKVQMLKVNATNTPDVLKAEARKVAELLGTMEAYNAWSVSFDVLAENLRRQVLSAWPKRRAVVQRMQTPFLQWLGFEITGEYGPAEPSPVVILNLVQTRPNLVIDNYHGPSGFPISEAAKVPYIELLNFPGKDGTETIEDVFRYNVRLIINAAPK